MKTAHRFPLLLLTTLLFFAPAIFAQQEEPVLFSNGAFRTGNNINRQVFKIEDLSAAVFGKKYFVLVQFSALPTALQKESLQRAGVELRDYLPGKAYLAAISTDFNFTLARQFAISSVNLLPSFYKIDAKLSRSDFLTDKQNEKRIAVNFYPTVDRATVIQALQNAGAVVTPTKFDNENTIFIQVERSVMGAVAALPFVTSLHLQSLTDKLLNYNDIATHGISGLNAPTGKNLQGQGVTVGVGDNGDISTHVDFSGRLIIRTPAKPDNHATHVAGTIGGAGIINIKNLGLAPKVTLINQYFSDVITNTPAYITDNNMVLTNNSYYSSEAGCPGSSEYDVLSNYADRQTGRYPQLLHVVAAGNDGIFACAAFPQSFATVKSGWQCAKNVLTVGAINTSDYTIGGFSSRGPVQDGRLKPEITAGGVGVTSTITNNNYGSNNGTSMASPVVTGALTLMYQRYRQTHGGANPRGSLMKALVCNTADDLGNAGPDFTFGFGMLNARRAVEAIDSNRYFINNVANGANTAHTITVPPNTRRLKVMLYWVDTAAAANAAVALVNDLDLTVTGPSSLNYPLVLNPTPAMVNNPAVGGVDHLNNIEQVVIENPAAGAYTFHVNGFALPFGPEEYVISYDLVKPSVTVEYPFGGEKWVPGETENIRWSAYGNEANSFTLQYSINNGASWVTIDNNVPASSKKYSWVIPSELNTSQALVRISQNGTSLIDQSDFAFTIAGSPVVTASNVCEGAVQLNWPAVAGAASYDILQLSGDSMRVIANTATTNYLVTGLDKNSTAWLAVTAKNGTLAGRRSVSAGVIPGGGACTLAAFNSDLKVDSILAPNTARQGFANAGNATQPIKVLIRNLGNVAVSGPLNISYRYANTTVTETLNGAIPAKGTYTYTFAGIYPVVNSGFKYNFKAWTSLAADPNHANDTAYKIVKYINNDAITSMPVTEGFETLPAATFTKAEMAIGDNKRLDFSASTTRGRARSFVNTGFAWAGTKAMTLDQAPYSDSPNADSLSLSYNLSNYGSKQLRMDFFYKNQGQEAAPGNMVWLRGSQNNVWVPAYDLFAHQSALGAWKHGIINVNEVLTSAVPPQIPTATFQVKIGEEGNTSANSANPETDIDDGYTFDNLTLAEALNDVGIVQLNSPGSDGCSLGAASPVGIRLKSYNGATLNNIPVSYQVNGGAVVTETIASLAPNQVLDYVFTHTANLSAYIDYTINVWVKYPTDTYALNDSIVNFNLHNSPVISSYPYLQNFEVNNGFFFTKGTNSSWQWGTPAKPVINKAASGIKAWTTNLTGNYNNNETSYLYSPCFDIHLLAQPVLSFSHILVTELNYDYSWVEYSTDGIVWQKLGSSGTGTNWYDDASKVAWGNGNTSWHVASIDLPASSGNIRFRFVLSSDGEVTEAGIGIDDIHVFDKAPVYTGSPITGITQNVSGNNWVNFSAGGNRVVSLNANGNNLGAVTVQANLYEGSVRYSNNQYYANRNIVVRPTLPAAGNVSVRFYFTEQEAQNLVNAEGCVDCASPTDPYEFGVTKYSGSPSDENGTLDDDTTGFYQYILPVNTVIVPYDNGYYAEFSVNSFSEFWLSAGSIKPAASGTCPGENILFNEIAGADSYQWQENRGAGFADISDGARYAGTHTDQLRLTGLPTSFSGYKYRCIWNSVTGSENAVRFVNTWNGGTSNNWFTAANWSCGIVPDQYTDVIIPNGVATYPVVNASTSVKSVRVHPGATVTVSAAAKLLVNGK